VERKIKPEESKKKQDQQRGFMTRDPNWPPEEVWKKFRRYREQGFFNPPKIDPGRAG